MLDSIIVRILNAAHAKKKEKGRQYYLPHGLGQAANFYFAFL